MKKSLTDAEKIVLVKRLLESAIREMQKQQDEAFDKLEKEWTQDCSGRDSKDS